jgi:hypothetical protein
MKQGLNSPIIGILFISNYTGGVLGWRIPCLDKMVLVHARDNH